MSKALETRVFSLERNFDKFKMEFEDRGKAHAANAEAMRQFSADNLRISEANTKLVEVVAKQSDEITRIKTESAFLTMATADLKEFARSVLDRMDSMEKSIAAMVVRDSTLKWAAKFILQSATFAGILIGIIQYFLK